MNGSYLIKAVSPLKHKNHETFALSPSPIPPIITLILGENI